jgi:hypothetical protein
MIYKKGRMEDHDHVMLIKFKVRKNLLCFSEKQLALQLLNDFLSGGM